MAPILDGDVKFFSENIDKVDIFRDTTEDVENLVSGNFSQDVINSSKAINNILNRDNKSEEEIEEIE